MSQLTEPKKMVSGWRKVFCTSIGDSTAIEDLEHDHRITSSSTTTPKHATRFRFFSSSTNPSTPHLRCQTTATSPAPSPAAVRSPATGTSSRLLNTSAPCSPSSFSFFKSTIRIRTRRCGLCLRSVKKGQGMATFTAECDHNFHFPCISDHVKKQGSLACPLCSCLWKEMPLLSVDDQKPNHRKFDEEKDREKLATRFVRPELKVYNDDEPLTVLTPTARFNPIPESDENCDEDCIKEFQGFCVNGDDNSPLNVRDVEVRISSKVALIGVSVRHQTYAIVLNVKAPPAPENIQQRAPIDLVAVVDVSGKMTNNKLQMMKKAMRSIVSSLSSSDRLSIVAFSSHSKRLLPLRRMTTTGRRAVRCIVEAMSFLEGTSNSNDAVKKAVKILLDRREKNPVAAVVLLSDDLHPPSRLDIPIHSLKLTGTDDQMLTKRIGNLLTVVVQDLRLQLGFVSCTVPAVITAVYSSTPQPIVLGSSIVEIGELSAKEERELLVELKLPSLTVWSQQVLSVRCRYRESSSQEIIYGQQQTLLVPRPTTVRSSSPTVQRLRNIFILTRALAESRRLTEGNDLTGAYHILVSAHALMKQCNSGFQNEFLLGLEAELKELQRRRKGHDHASQRLGEEKPEPLTPISAWRMADKLAKAAMIRKSVNRVSDLHGFEDARF